jgi:hypothetical protein
MTTLAAPASDLPLTEGPAAQRLRRTAAAVRVHFTWWGTHRTLTPRQKEEVGAACSADAKLLTAGKRLVDTRHPALRKLTAVKGRTSAYWRGITLPYVEAGVRLLRQADVPAFHHVLEGFRGELHEAEADLNRVYEEVKADAQSRLGRLYDDRDYPPEVQGLFDLSWEFPAIEPPAYLLRISPELYEEERARVAAKFEEAVRLAEQAFVAELAALVDHLTERLAPGPEGTAKVFRNSALGNFQDFLGRFALLNVRSNPELDALVERAQGLLQGVTPDAVRTAPELRDKLRTGMNEVRQQLDGLIVEAPRRRIVRPTPISEGGSHGVGG